MKLKTNNNHTAKRTVESNFHLDLPPGYIRNTAGHLVPEELVRESDLIRDAIARDLALEAERLNTELIAFKKKALSDIADLITIAADRYGVQLGGKKGNVSISTYDGEYRVQRSISERITFTEEIEAAKELINDCIMRWSEGANVNIRALVDRAFRTNAKGQIRTASILELLRLEIDDEGWARAMEALTDSIQSAGTSVYIRVYKRVGQTDQYLALPLDLAAV
jgi:hypothetical protein